MERLLSYFRNARTCQPNTRKGGLEIETLYVDSQGMPLSLELSQRILKRLAKMHGWSIKTMHGTLITRMNAPFGCELLYELGAGNFEMITPATMIPRGPLARLPFWGWRQNLAQLAQAAHHVGCVPVEGSFDGHAAVDNLVLPDVRDEVWRELDGGVLTVLGHISSVHLNIDLCSIEEGLFFMAQLESYRQKMSWPPREVQLCWNRYINGSPAGYENDRYGPPPTRSFEAYCTRLSELKVVMMRGADGYPVMCQPARSFAQTPGADMKLFLRSVWWYCRLRVRNGQLVLEIRFIPRGTDEDMHRSVEQMLTHLDLIDL